MRRTWPCVLAGLLLGGACGVDGGDGAMAQPLDTTDEPSETVTSDPPDDAVSPVAAAAATPTMPSTTTAVPSFASSIREVSAEELGASWRDGCPVAVEDLRWVELAHWDDRGEAMIGALVLHEDHAADVVTVFARLFDAGFPIHSMRPITEFGGDDDASMTANNTSAFNCREIDGRPGVWSQHAYGGAIDINPLVNPWVRGSRVDPPEGAPFVERDPSVPGLIVDGDVVTEAFAAIGWGWGGHWTNALDYQHFSHNGG